jgi:hypothetical protein
MSPLTGRFGLKYDPYGFVWGTPPKIPQGLTVPPKERAKTPSYVQLVNELDNYLRDEVKGRSCLVAGSRGSGKTTLVQTVCDEVARSATGFKLIKVRLHGPSILDPPTPPATKENPQPKPIPLNEHVLKTIVVNLYQTAAEEVVNAFTERMKNRGRDGLRDEGLELAAQLRLTLDGAPSAATLRFFWDRAGVLESGVLFPKDGKFEPDRGMREIVALATAAEAYRSCTGEFKQERKDETSAGSKQELKTETTAGGKEIAQALMSLFGGLAAGAAASITMDLTKSVLTGAVTALASMVTLTYTRTVSRETTVQEAITFLPDLSASALVHRMLLLLRRLRQAGLAPVFVVDELDKIPDLAKPLDEVTAALKFLFADEAFVCFLTDRNYFSQISRVNRERTNAVQKTTFTDQLLVRFETAELHNFLERVIRPYGDVDENTKAELNADAEALRYILIQQSRMLMFELAAAISSITGEEFWLDVAFRSPRTELVSQFHLMLQLAIEVILVSPYVASRLERDPDFAPTIYDALYYPTRRWYKDSSVPLDCSPGPLMTGIQELTGEELNLSPPDEMFLHAQVKILLDLVANPATLENALHDADASGRLKVSAPVRQAIPDKIPLLNRTGENTYEWLYNRYGIPRGAGDITIILNDQNLRVGDDMIAAFVEALGESGSKRLTVREVLDSIAGADLWLGEIAGRSILGAGQ